jgi:hypothetical protein
MTHAESLGVRVTITRSAGVDGAPVVLVDTDPERVGDGERGPRMRILPNDEPVYEGEADLPVEKRR